MHKCLLFPGRNATADQATSKTFTLDASAAQTSSNSLIVPWEFAASKVSPLRFQVTLLTNCRGMPSSSCTASGLSMTMDPREGSKLGRE